METRKSQWKLRRGQAMSLQWVCFLLQKIETKSRGSSPNLINRILDGALSGGKNRFGSLQLGCTVASRFLLPFAIELALKSALMQQDVVPPRSHDLGVLHKALPDQVKAIVDIRLKQLKLEVEDSSNKSACELAELIRNDFIEWRYLDKPENLLMVSGKTVQAYLSSLLDYLFSLPE